ncbi:MAG: MarR family transcriptional regulator [Gemmatimonadales bacterium]|nr:MarR family transcriptional regulator [Gemmatimonadales bacterium]
MATRLPIQELRQASRRMVRQLGLLSVGNGSPGPTLPECHVLIELAGESPLTITRLAERLAVDKSTMSRTVGRLGRRGLVEASVKAADKRAKLVCLTPKGRRQVRRIDRQADRQVAAALELLAPADQAAVVEGLELYAKALTRSRAQRDFIVRPIRRSDNAALARLIRGVMREYGIADDPCAADGTEVDAMFEAYQRDRWAYFVVARGRRVVGGGGIGPLEGADDSICELRKMYFLPEARGLGLGRTLLDTCLATARELGYRTCYLETAGSMGEAHRLYERAGFRERKTPLGKTVYTSCERRFAMAL